MGASGSYHLLERSTVVVLEDGVFVSNWSSRSWTRYARLSFAASLCRSSSGDDTRILTLPCIAVRVCPDVPLPR